MLARLSLLALCASMASAENYAVLVCGSNEYYNYRHHADVAHAYQVLTRGGVKAENIITMMYDDVPHSSENPYPGQLFNKPASTLAAANDVYASVKDHIDYKGADVTPANFLAVLTGDSAGAGGKKVLQTGPEDNVFVNFADHGGPGIIGFPGNAGFMYEKDLIQALDTMYQKKMYKQLVFYLEACESGSMWVNLPKDRNIYALSAANGEESSWGTYCDHPVVGKKNIGTCLGDLFSVNWMEDDDVTDLSAETLQAQFNKVKKLTTKSHVLQWGQTSMGSEEASVFEGTGKTAPSSVVSEVERSEGDDVDSRDIGLVTRYNLYMQAGAAERPARAAALVAEIQHREEADAKFAALAAKLALPAELDASLSTAHRDCHKPAHEAVVEYCGAYTDYSLKHAKVAAAACNHWKGDSAKVIQAVMSVCGY
eukprot:TRINITY_DN389_c0_g1_i11.p2 TRINITY_DN389_c0_g1~~TRINITY_DN389_c0_g1_i11.p2  ORF type:complete len:426 (+),score=232.13 TRINITY_DN389_c0_g1_i11:64-1341(+)